MSRPTIIASSRRAVARSGGLRGAQASRPAGSARPGPSRSAPTGPRASRRPSRSPTRDDPPGGCPTSTRRRPAARTTPAGRSPRPRAPPSAPTSRRKSRRASRRSVGRSHRTGCGQPRGSPSSSVEHRPERQRPERQRKERHLRTYPRAERGRGPTRSARGPGAPRSRSASVRVTLGQQVAVGLPPRLVQGSRGRAARRRSTSAAVNGTLSKRPWT